MGANTGLALDAQLMHIQHLVFVQRMGCPADVLQVGQPRQDGHQKLHHFGLAAVFVELLFQGNALELLGQPDVCQCAPQVCLVNLFSYHCSQIVSLWQAEQMGQIEYHSRSTMRNTEVKGGGICHVML